MSAITTTSQSSASPNASPTPSANPILEAQQSLLGLTKELHKLNLFAIKDEMVLADVYKLQMKALNKQEELLELMAKKSLFELYKRTN